MKMKPFISSALLALGLSACADSSPALQVKSAFAQGPDCSFSNSDTALLGGSVDMGLRPASSFPIVFNVTSNLSGVTIEVGEQPVGNDADLNTIYVTGMSLRYSSSAEGLTFTQSSATVPLYGALSGSGNVLLSLFTAQTAADLNNYVSSGRSAEVLVALKLKAERAAGDELDSNEIVFPVFVYASDVAALQTSVCGAGKQFKAPTEPCDQRGLNGVLPECEDIPTTP